MSILIPNGCLFLVYDLAVFLISFPFPVRSHSFLFMLGYVCGALSVDPESRCCPRKGDRYSCQWVVFLISFELKMSGDNIHKDSSFLFFGKQWMQPQLKMLQLLWILCVMLPESFTGIFPVSSKCYDTWLAPMCNIRLCSLWEVFCHCRPRKSWQYRWR